MTDRNVAGHDGELGTAADKLRALTAAATQLPWRKHDAEYPHLVIQAPADVPATDCDGMISTNLTPNESADAAYIAAMQPTVGAAVADWLGCMAMLDPAERGGAVCGWCGIDHALTIARALNAPTTR